MGVLTPRQALENRFQADARNIETLSPMSSILTRACLVADCAARFVEAKKTGDRELLRAAEDNLTRATAAYTERMRP